jgi:hypothetical protein
MIVLQILIGVGATKTKLQPHCKSLLKCSSRLLKKDGNCNEFEMPTYLLDLFSVHAYKNRFISYNYKTLTYKGK